jgi:hypothetical protein
MALMIAGATTTGGLGAFAMKQFFTKAGQKKTDLLADAKDK